MKSQTYEIQSPARHNVTDIALIQNAHLEVSKALKQHKLNRPNICQKCGNESFTEAHHDDYTKPLDVKWFCRSCHHKLISPVHKPRNIFCKKPCEDRLLPTISIDEWVDSLKNELGHTKVLDIW